LINSHQTNPKVEDLLSDINSIILGKDNTIRLALTCLLAKGHLLIEDLPGVGKTTLAHTLAKVVGLDFQRIQFTSDLLPADILGISIYDTESKKFNFHPGAIFSQLLLADEINRATPKTQSALLEAMEEKQVTIERNTHILPSPFFVIATQNPSNQIGTFALPESQLDRFLMSIKMGYPDIEHERKLLISTNVKARLSSLNNRITPEQLISWQEDVEKVHVSEALITYVLSLITASRNNPNITHGLSPRAGQGLLQAAKAWAWLAGMTQVQPEHVQAVWLAVTEHRLSANHKDSFNQAKQLIESVAIP